MNLGNLTSTRKEKAKFLLTLPPGDLRPVDLSKAKYVPSWCDRAWQNNRYVVMCDDHAELIGSDKLATRVVVQRVDGSKIPNHWKEMQNIKNFLFGKEATAVEFYPPESELHDIFDMYWFWIFPEGIMPKPVITWSTPRYPIVQP